MSRKLFTLLCCMTLFFNFNSKASIVVTDIVPDSVKTFSTSIDPWFGIDFDTDGTQDCTFGWYKMGIFTKRLYCTPTGTNRLVVTGSMSSSTSANIITPMDSGTVIDNSLLFASAAGTLSPIIFDNATSNFTDLGDKYIGVEFMIGSNVHYGWIQVNYTSSQTLTVKRYGYETVAGQGIPTGNPTGPTVVLKPKAGYTTTITTTDTKTSITFTDISTNTPTAWQWTFTPATVTFTGGTSATSQHPQVLFGAAGKYTVKLKATNTGGSDSITKVDYMVVNAAPAANFTTTATTTDTKTTMTFTDISTNTPTAWEWTFTPATVSFMGGTSTTSQHPQVLFGAAGKYTVKLKVTNAAGSDSVTKVDYMVVNAAPVADFTTTATTTDTKTTMTFTDICTNMPTAWEWTFTPATVTFMGGTSATSQNPQVLFGATGKYTVKLKATNIAGSDSITKNDYMEVKIPTGIITYEADEELLSIFPNPASNFITIHNPGEGVMSILDVNGRTAWSGPVNGTSVQLDISGLPKGYYTLRVTGEQKVANGKLIVQ